MIWRQLSVITSAVAAEDISDLFSELGAASVTYMDAENQPVYEPKPGETKIWRKTRVIGLFTAEIDLDRIAAVVLSRLHYHPLENWRQETLQDQIWERTWMKFYQPMKFSDKLWVCPTGQEQNEAGTVCLTLDPGLAFGTGTHPTTALCLKWLATDDLCNKTLVDFGCGSGILAIAAILLGAKRAYALDIDPQALTATRDNAKKNHVTTRIECFSPEQFPDIKADIVIANILATPLIDLARRISTLVKPSGKLVLSGILHEQVEAVGKAYASSFMLAPPVAQKDWRLISGQKI